MRPVFISIGLFLGMILFSWIIQSPFRTALNHTNGETHLKTAMYINAMSISVSTAASVAVGFFLLMIAWRAVKALESTAEAQKNIAAALHELVMQKSKEEKKS